MDGRHIKIHARGNNMMGEEAWVGRVLTELVDRIGMRALGAPQTYSVEQCIEKLGAHPFTDEGGVTGVVVLSTSHIAIHTWPLRHYFTLDVYSCRDFDTDVVLDLVKDRLGAYNIAVHDLSPTLRYAL